MLLIFFICLLINLQVRVHLSKEKIYCIAIIIFISFAYAANEFLSIFRALDRKHLLLVYLVAVIILCTMLLKKIKKISLKKCIQSLKVKQSNKQLLCLFSFVAAGLALAILTVPYNWDSMTYHLSRIAHWAQNKSIAHYAANDVRQVTSPPLAEFINLQVYLFSGERDYFLNVLQYTSFITNAILVFFISKKLRAAREYCWLSLLIFVSMPIAFGEALSTQVDQFATVFLLIFVYFLLDILDLEYQLRFVKESLFYVCILSCCIAYGYLAKPSVIFAMLFFAIWLLIVCIRRKDKFWDVLRLALISGLIITLLLAPEVGRNLITFNAISAPIAGERQLIGTFHPIYVLLNGIKNFAMNLPNVYLDWHWLLEDVIFLFADFLRVDINDSAISEDGGKFYLHQAATYGHDTAINPLVIIMMMIVAVWLIFKRIKNAKWEKYESYSWIVIASFLFFCCILRWEPYVTRYMLSYLALLCPLAAIWLTNLSKRKWASNIAIIVIFMCIVELVGLAQYHGKICIRQLLAEERREGYFSVRGGVRKQYAELMDFLNENEFERLGLYLASTSYEYPIWAKAEGQVRIENVNVKNTTAIYADSDFVPEVIVVIDRNPEDIVHDQEELYECIFESGDNMSVWRMGEKLK